MALHLFFFFSFAWNGKNLVCGHYPIFSSGLWNKRSIIWGECSGQIVVPFDLNNVLQRDVCSLYWLSSMGWMRNNTFVVCVGGGSAEWFQAFMYLDGVHVGTTVLQFSFEWYTSTIASCYSALDISASFFVHTLGSFYLKGGEHTPNLLLPSDGWKRMCYSRGLQMQFFKCEYNPHCASHFQD